MTCAGGGFLNVVRSFLWIPVQQYTTREITVQLYDHLHRLVLLFYVSFVDAFANSAVDLLADYNSSELFLGCLCVGTLEEKLVKYLGLWIEAHQAFKAC